MKLKRLKLILEALYQIKEHRNDSHGICNNLYFKVDGTDDVEEFLALSFHEKYGNRDIEYPIEGSRYVHQHNFNKWDLSTEYGAKRMELLEFMIQYCIKLIDEKVK